MDLRPQLERLDRLIRWSEGIDEGALSFAFRPLWQLDEPARAALRPCAPAASASTASVRWFGDDEIQAPSLRGFVTAIAAGRFDFL